MFEIKTWCDFCFKQDWKGVEEIVSMLYSTFIRTIKKIRVKWMKWIQEMIGLILLKESEVVSLKFDIVLKMEGIILFLLM